MASSGSYLALGDERNGMDYSPDMARRCKAAEVWATLKFLGREGVAALVDRLCRNAQAIAAGLQDAGFTVLDAASTYFLCVDLAATGIDLDDEAFAAASVEKAGVAVVPLSAFAEEDPPRHLVRLCFGKKDQTIDSGVAAMATAKALLA